MKLAIRFFCLLPFLTGLLDLWNGTGIMISAGAFLGGAGQDAVLNSQIRFWGAIWFGFGVLCWHASSRLETDPGLFRICCGTLVLAGLGRIISLLQYGAPGPILEAAAFVELVGPSVLLVRSQLSGKNTNN